MRSGKPDMDKYTCRQAGAFLEIDDGARIVTASKTRKSKN
jgi:hypothetical protein